MSKCVLFDLDETLFDRTQTLRSFLATQFVRFNHVLGNADLQTWVTKFLMMDQRGKTPKRQLYPELIGAFRGDVRQADALIVDYYENSTRAAIPMSGMDTVLTELSARDCHVGIVTNGETDLQTRTLDSLGLSERIPNIIISESVGLRKPERVIFLRAAQMIGLDPEHCLFVGDHPVSDILGAQRAGMQTAWFNPSQLQWPETEAPNPGAEISELRQILRLV